MLGFICLFALHYCCGLWFWMRCCVGCGVCVGCVVWWFCWLLCYGVAIFDFVCLRFGWLRALFCCVSGLMFGWLGCDCVGLFAGEWVGVVFLSACGIGGFGLFA